jgi:hypothetical protein
MDREAWYSVTPEGIARHIAQFMAERCSGGIIVDAFCGVFLLKAILTARSAATQFISRTISTEVRFSLLC